MSSASSSLASSSTTAPLAGGGAHVIADLQLAVQAMLPYPLLAAPLQLQVTQAEYHQQLLRHAIRRTVGYGRLPQFLRLAVEERWYYAQMVSACQEQLKLYPYAHIRRIVELTRETPLTYYVAMLADRLRTERSYDTLPNFTALDILNHLGIGRNQYLELTREVRSKLMWRIHRAFVTDFLPTELLPSVTLDPFWEVRPVEVPSSEALRRSLLGHHGGSGSSMSAAETDTYEVDLALYRALLLHRQDVVSGSLRRLLTERESLSSALTRLEIHHGVFDAQWDGQGDTAAASPPPGGEAPTSPRPAATAPTMAPNDMIVYACQLPRAAVHRLYRKGLVYVTLAVDPSSALVVPPLESFVMNRSSSDPHEVFLYRVLSTVDERTPLALLAQLLAVEEEDTCDAAGVLLRLGLAQYTVPVIPVAFLSRDTGVSLYIQTVHHSWAAEVHTRIKQLLLLRRPESPAAPPDSTSEEGRSYDDEEVEEGVEAVVRGGEARSRRLRPTKAAVSLVHSPKLSTHPRRRLALLYDASLTGFLMMTNLSSNPAFKQCAVTLFEIGKLSDELVSVFVDQLEEVSPGLSATFGGEAERYVSSVLCLREVLQALRSLKAVEDVAADAPEHRGVYAARGSGCGVDMLKIESLNELAATTRYSVLGRNYWAYLVISPVSFAPLIDVAMSNVYGSTINLMPSPWLTLFLYSRMRYGPPCLFLPFGASLHAWPPQLLDDDMDEQLSDDVDADGAAPMQCEIRLQPLTLDAEITYVSPALSLILVSEMTSKAPLFVQLARRTPMMRKPDGFYTEAAAYVSFEAYIPFTATDEELHTLVRDQFVAAANGSAAWRAAVGDPATVEIVLDRPDDVDNGSAPTLLAGPPRRERARVNVCSGTAHDRPLIGVPSLLRQAVVALDVADSVGYFVVSMTLVLVQAAPKGRLEVCSAAIVDIGLGLPLIHYGCCAVALRHLPALLHDEARCDAHSAAMRRLEGEFSEFLQRYSSVTRAAREKSALQSSTASGPATQQHLRKLAADGHSGSPFPSSLMLFNGTDIVMYDEMDDLCELW